MKTVLLSLGLLSAAGGAAAACPLPDKALHKGVVQLAWKPVGGAITVGQPFTLDMQVCPSSATLVRVDATMPAHRHGMNYRPSIQATGDGAWRAEGLMFHMPGHWQLQWQVRTPDGVETLVDGVDLK